MLQVRCARPAGAFAPERPFGTFRCSGRLILRKEYTVLFAPKRSTFRFAALALRGPSHRNAPSGHSGVPVGLFYAKSYTVLFAPKRSTFRFAALTLRVSSHRNAPSGHSGVPVGLFYAKSYISTLCSKTLDLQVRCAHPTGVFAPKCPFGTFRCSGRLILRKEHTVLFAPKRSTLQVRCAHPTPVAPERPFGTFRCSGRLILRKELLQYSLLQNARSSGSLRSPCGCLRTVTSLRNVPVLRMAYLNKRATCALLFKTLMLQVRRAHPAGTGELRIPPPPFTAGAGTSEKEMRQKTEGRSAEKLLK